MAVDFFFCLSGFVIAFTYQNRLEQGITTFGSFSRARLIRLYPMYFIGMFLLGALSSVPKFLIWPCIVLGEISYPLYLIHYLFIKQLRAFGDGFVGGGSARELVLPSAVLLLAAISYAVAVA